MGDSSKPSFTFINISHPNELRDQEMLTHIRCSAMSSFGRQLRLKRAGKKKRKKNEIVFELREPGLMPLSRVGVTAADPFDSTRLGWDAETTGLMTNSMLTLSSDFRHIYRGADAICWRYPRTCCV